MSTSTNCRAGSPHPMLIDRRPILKAMLNPKTVALIGATEAPGSVGRILMENLLSFGGVVYPINPKRSRVLGVETWPNPKFFVIDAHKVARECNMRGRINTIMQTCFFAISRVLPRSEAIAAIKDLIGKSRLARPMERKVQRLSR